MNSLNQMIELRKKELESIQKQVDDSAKDVPEGHLRVCKRNGIPRFYHMTNDPEDKYRNGTYIRKDNIALAKALAQKDYNQSVYKLVKKELSKLEHLGLLLESDDIEGIYRSLSESRQKLVSPCIKPKEEFVRQWKEVQYERKGFAEGTPEIITEQGERVRSKSEKIIADKLFIKGIPYRYECPLLLHGYGRIHPDFTVLNVRTRKEYYWEHLGMMDNPAYFQNVLVRLEQYEKNNILPGQNLILTYETAARPLDSRELERKIRIYLN